MADFSAAAGGLNVGTLTINLALNTSDLAKKLDEVNRHTKSMADKMKAEFDKMGGHLGNFGERIGQASKAIEKMFGDKAPAAMQKMGKELAAAVGLSESQLKGLKQTAESLEGAFKLAGLAVGALLSPLGAVLAAALGVAAAVGAVRNAFDALKGSGGGNAARGQEYARNQQWVMDNVPGASTAARVGEQLFSWAGDRAKSDWNRAANTPGSFVETVDKMDVAGDLKAALGRVAKDLEGALGPFMKMLQPGTSAADKAKSAEERSKGSDRLMSAFGAINKEFDENLTEKLEYLADLDLKNAQMAAEREHDIRKQQLDEYEQQTRDFNDELARVQDEQIQAAQDIERRWQALGSGQIGTAAGVGGIAGNALNIVGGAASQYQYTGIAMQGAAQGASNGGGPWGAVIGAIVALATQTESFRKLMAGIEGALEGILPLLSELLEPIVASITGALDVLSPVLKLITKLADALGQVLKPVYAFADAIGDLLDAIGGAIDAIDLGGLTGALDKSVGSSDDQWGKYSVNDWLTGVGPLISELGNEINKAVNGDGSPAGGEFTAADGPSALAQELEAKQKAERRAAWDLDPRNPYYMQNINALALAKAEERQREAKEAETREAERAAAALRELADSVTNAVEGYKLEGAMYRSQDSITRSPATGNPYA